MPSNLQTTKPLSEQLWALAKYHQGDQTANFIDLAAQAEALERANDKLATMLHESNALAIGFKRDAERYRYFESKAAKAYQAGIGEFWTIAAPSLKGKTFGEAVDDGIQQTDKARK